MTDRPPAAAAFHAAIEEALDELGRDKAWLSRETGIARSTINDWKRNPRPPKAKSVNLVADILDMDRDEARRLAGFTSTPVVDASGEAVPLTEVDTDSLLAEVRRRIEERAEE